VFVFIGVFSAMLCNFVFAHSSVWCTFDAHLIKSVTHSLIQ